ncbi:DUF599 domain-containing protein [Inhella sp.]|uniref:DUF599 domain-containing protein n=1 Tax=Inhella sp. TaxID=1921806 RepID=UPI0035B49153
MPSFLTLLPAADWAALLLFFAAWTGYAHWARRRSLTQPSLLATTNRWRREWMLQSTWRDNRIVDAAVTQSLSASPAFFASTSILIIGALLAVLASTDRATKLMLELPFAARTTPLMFDFKVAVLVAIFVFAFFRFTWSLRQYSFGAILVGATPDTKRLEDDQTRQRLADRAGAVMGMAAETFNDGLRAYYLSFAVLAWFVSPWAFMAATAAVVLVLYRREFHSDVLGALRMDQ